MKSRVQTSVWAATWAVALALSCEGCFLFHQRSAYRPIHEYAKAGDAVHVDQDLSKNPGDLNLPDDAGLTPLHLAVLHCHTNVVMLLLDRGAKVNRQAKDEATPLHLAAQEGCAGAVKVLLAKGAKVNARDDQGRTPLKRAGLWHQSAVAELLRQHGGTE
jgi:ankyrin repeat protein